MACSLNIFSNLKGEINSFLSKFYNTNLDIYENLKWEKLYKNPVEMVDLIGAFIDNSDKFDINLWICLDEDVYINVTDKNADDVIKYLFERYPL
ncbi:MAG: hypothetical protein IJV31_03630 [Clostridia bacterium]|nr:hypothetical protein [Clostridia bacterium]